jgi:hypothetical protein
MIASSGGSAVRLGGHSRKLSNPISSLQLLLAVARRKWNRSIGRAVLVDLYRFPLRIVASRLFSIELRRGLRVPSQTLPASSRQPGTKDRLLLACNAGMERLLAEHQWAGRLDQKVYFQAFHEGVEFALHNACMNTLEPKQDSLSFTSPLALLPKR